MLVCLPAMSRGTGRPATPFPLMETRAPPDVTKKLLAGQPVDPSQVYFKTVPTFETSAPELQWLTRSIFIGTGERHPSDVVIRVWKVD